MTTLSVLDLAPILEGGDASQAFRNTLDLAQHCERWGYQRYWLAEHHNMPGVASAATSVVIGYVAGGTKSLRVGAGGVMLPNHAPLVIAEQFGTLASLYPGRIELGLGRAPGTDPLTTAALRRYAGSADTFPDDVIELMSYFRAAEPQQAVRAVPGAGLDVPIWILGSSLFGAQLAAVLGLPFAFASHFAPAQLMPAIAIYRERFRPSERLAAPYLMLGVSAFAAETDEEAQRLSTSLQLAFAALRRGRPGPLRPPVDDVEGEISPVERAALAQVFSHAIVGSPETVRRGLEAFAAQTGADELMVTSQIFDHAARLRSFEIVASVGGLTPPARTSPNATLLRAPSLPAGLCSEAQARAGANNARRRVRRRLGALCCTAVVAGRRRLLYERAPLPFCTSLTNGRADPSAEMARPNETRPFMSSYLSRRRPTRCAPSSPSTTTPRPFLTPRFAPLLASLLVTGCAPAPQGAAGVPTLARAADAGVVPISTRSAAALAPFERGFELAARDRRDEAIAEIALALRLDPDFAQAHALFATLAEGEAASTHRARARQLGPRLPALERLYVEITIGDRGPEGLASLAKLASSDRHVLTDLALFKVYRELDKPGAIAAFERLRALDPRNDSTHRHLAFLYADARRWSLALEAAAAHVRLAPAGPEPLDVEAEVLLAAGEFDRAEATFARALALDADFVDARAGIASVKFYRGDWGGGLAELERGAAAARRPEGRARLTEAFGWALVAAGRPDAGRTALERAEAARDDRSGPPLLDVYLAIERADWAEARRSAELALAATARGSASSIERRWVELLHSIASSRAGDLAAAERGLSLLEAGAAGLEPWVTKDVSFARGHLALARRDAGAAVAAFTDRWVLNHNSLFDPGRGRPQPSVGQFALKGRLLAAEALARAGRVDEAMRALDELAHTYHRGVGAVMVHWQAKRALGALTSGRGALHVFVGERPGGPFVDGGWHSRAARVTVPVPGRLCRGGASIRRSPWLSHL